MANELAHYMEWTFMQEVDTPRDVIESPVPGEETVTTFKTIRETATFTTRRLIVRDSQGLTGKKVECYSLPWSAANMWSVENAGHLDLNAEAELWTRAGHSKINLKRGADVKVIDRMIAQYVL